MTLVSARRLAERIFAIKRVLDVGRRGRHGIELVQEAIDGGRLLLRVGDVVAHQFLCLAHRFVPELQPKLTAQLCPQQFGLAARPVP